MIIGFGHKAQTGKDTAGNYLVKYYGFEKVSFAHKLKEMCSLLTGIPIEEFNGEGKLKYNEEWGMTHREILQILGTNAIRNHFHEDSWVKSTMNSLKPGGKYVFTDVRFPNEVKAIQEKGAAVKINRSFIKYDINESHESETALDNFIHWDHHLDNNSSLPWLHGQIDGIMMMWQIKKRKKWQVFLYHTIPNTTKRILNGITKR